MRWVFVLWFAMFIGCGAYVLGDLYHQCTGATDVGLHAPIQAGDASGQLDSTGNPIPVNPPHPAVVFCVRGPEVLRNLARVVRVAFLLWRS